MCPTYQMIQIHFFFTRILFAQLTFFFEFSKKTQKYISHFSANLVYSFSPSSISPCIYTFWKKEQIKSHFMLLGIHIKNTPLSEQMSASDLDFSVTISRLNKWSFMSSSCSTFQYDLSTFTVFYISPYIKYILKSF